MLTLGYIGNMVGIGASGLTDKVSAYYFSAGKWVLLAACLASTPIVPWLGRRFSESRLSKSRAAVMVFDLLRSAALTVLFIVCIAVCAKSAYNPFIYYNF